MACSEEVKQGCGAWDNMQGLVAAAAAQQQPLLDDEVSELA
jgi:hypothetical protein